jgi:aminodeoxyfutalosine synthase
MHGRKTYFNVNQHVNYTNICIYSCKFCAFAAKEGEERAYLMTPEIVEQKVREQLHRPVSEVHMVAGLHPQMGYDYYIDVVRAAKRARPDIHVKAFTMVEIEHILNLGREEHGKSEDEVFAELREAGLGSCPGGGAEVLTDRVHKAVFREKMGPDRWLATARQVQQHGFKMNATMLYGHIERTAERVEHLIKLRDLQDECGNFMAYIPLAFWPYHTDLENYGHVTTGHMDLRNIAVGRLMLDNFPHIKAYWIMLTPNSAQTALGFGANDIDGTVTEEKITHDAGTTAPQALSERQLLRLIREAGFEPVLRNTTYDVERVISDGDQAIACV